MPEGDGEGGSAASASKPVAMPSSTKGHARVLSMSSVVSSDDGGERTLEAQTPPVDVGTPSTPGTPRAADSAASTPTATTPGMASPRLQGDGGGGRKRPSGLPIGSLSLAQSAALPLGDSDNFKYKGVNISPGPQELVAGGQKYKARLEDFDKVRILGKGTHAVVWQVTSRSLGITMAWKEMEMKKFTEEEAKRIVTELSVLKKARRSPHITALHGVFYKKHRFYLLMEYMDCGSLDKLLAKHVARTGRGMPERVIAAVGYSVLDGLSFLKEHLKVMHRDIKPANILINSKGQIKMCDFSICKELRSHASVNTYIGTVYYMAPERIKPTADKGYDTKADLWSLGVTLVELATGVYPYPREAHDIFAMCTHIVRGPTAVERPEVVAAGLSDDCIDFCRSCVQRSPKNRADHQVLLKHTFFKHVATAEEVQRWLESLDAGAVTGDSSHSTY
eukprot:m.54957 g.54957  ORF g.54957 m.54957 type:complete len:449 (+) comp7570_c0_seq1:119-1465(+)